jgi:hypothetical protein
MNRDALRTALANFVTATANIAIAGISRNATAISIADKECNLIVDELVKVLVPEVSEDQEGSQKPIDPHVMQEIVVVNDVIRFRENRIVRLLLDTGPYNLNTLALMDFSDEDRMQLAQLIGCSVSGFGELSYAHPDVVAEADRRAEKLLKDIP